MFIAYDVARQLITQLRTIIPVIQQADADLADQLRRAATSVLLNLAEGQKSGNGNKLRHYKIAQDSAQEIGGALDAVEAWGSSSSSTMNACCSIGCAHSCGSSPMRQSCSPDQLAGETAEPHR